MWKRPIISQADKTESGFVRFKYPIVESRTLQIKRVPVQRTVSKQEFNINQLKSTHTRDGALEVALRVRQTDMVAPCDHIVIWHFRYPSYCHQASNVEPVPINGGIMTSTDSARAADQIMTIQKIKGYAIINCHKRWNPKERNNIRSSTPSGLTLDLAVNGFLNGAFQGTTQLAKVFCRLQLFTAESTHKAKNRDGTDDGRER